MLPLIFFLSLVCRHSGSSFSDLADANPDDGPKIYFYHNNPYHISVYRVTEGSLTGVQNTFDHHNHDNIAKDEEFTVFINFTSPVYNEERKWYEILARFCYGTDIGGCVRNQTRSFTSPYLVRPSSVQIPVPFVVPFSKVHSATFNGKNVLEAGTVHEQFKTFEVNGAKYDASSGILISFSAVSPEKAGKISGIDFLRDTRRALKQQPLVQCYFVEWTADGCVPGLDNLMLAYNVKNLQLKYRPWLKIVEFPEHRDDKYTETLDIPGIGEKTYLVFKDMALEQSSSAIAHPFVYLFMSVEEQVNTTIESVGLRYGQEQFLGSGKYKSISKHYEKPSYSAAMSGTEFRFFRASMSVSYIRDEANWDEAFKTRWNSLFHKSTKVKAMDFFNDYGTHYVVNAVMGGRQEAVFTVDYCKASKDKLDFETQLIKPYKFISRADIQEYYMYIKSHSMSKIILRDPQITCTGGNYLDSEVCYNLTLWRSSVLNNPYPITMTLRPFYTLSKVYEDSLWLKKMYEEYLKDDLDEAKLKLKAKCEHAPTTEPPLSPGSIVGIVIGILVLVAFVVIFIKYQRIKLRFERTTEYINDILWRNNRLAEREEVEGQDNLGKI